MEIYMYTNVYDKNVLDETNRKINTFGYRQLETKNKYWGCHLNWYQQDTIHFFSQFDKQYIPRNMHTVVALLCFVVVIHWLIFPYPSGLLHWHCGNLTIAPVPAKQPWWIWINTSCEFIMNDCITTTKQSTTKPCAYFLGYTVQSYVNVQGLLEQCDFSFLWDQGMGKKSRIVLCYFKQNIKEPPYWPFVRGIYWWLVDFPQKGPLTREAFPCDDGIMPTGKPKGRKVINLSTEHTWRLYILNNWSRRKYKIDENKLYNLTNTLSFYAQVKTQGHIRTLPLFEYQDGHTDLFQGQHLNNTMRYILLIFIIHHFRVACLLNRTIVKSQWLFINT